MNEIHHHIGYRYVTSNDVIGEIHDFFIVNSGRYIIFKTDGLNGWATTRDRPYGKCRGCIFPTNYELRITNYELYLGFYCVFDIPLQANILI